MYSYKYIEITNCDWTVLNTGCASIPCSSTSHRSGFNLKSQKSQIVIEFCSASLPCSLSWRSGYNQAVNQSDPHSHTPICTNTFDISTCRNHKLWLNCVVNLSHCCASMPSSRTRSSYNQAVNQPDSYSHTPIAGWEGRQCPSFLYENNFTFLFKTSTRFLDASFVFYWSFLLFLWLRWPGCLTKELIWFNRPLNFMLCCFYWITSILYSQMFLWSWCLTKGLRFLPRPPLMLDLNTHAFHQSPDEGNELSSHQIASMQCIISHYITGAWVKITRWC